MGQSERLQRVKANFHEHPVRDWLLVAIGVAGLIIAIITLRNQGSGTSSGGSPLPIPGGGGGGGIPPTPPTGPVQGNPIKDPNPPYIPIGPPTTTVDFGPQTVQKTSYAGSDSASDPTYGAGIDVRKILQAVGFYKSGGQQTTPGPRTDSQSDPSYGSNVSQAPTTSSGGGGRYDAATAQAQKTSLTTSSVQTAPTHPGTQAPAHVVAQPQPPQPYVLPGLTIRRGRQ